MAALLVTTIVWALPLGHRLTNQHVSRRQVLGAFVVVVGLALFVLASLVVAALVVLLLLWVRRKRAPALVSFAEAATAWATWALLGFGFATFLIQQLSLATGRIAPALAAVSVANPGVSVVLGGAAAPDDRPRPDPTPA